MSDREHLMEFVEFNPNRFLKESKTWKGEIAKRKTELESMSELPAMESSGVQTSNISDMTRVQAFSNIELKEEIHKYERLTQIKKETMRKLPEKQQEVINGFFFGRKHVSTFIDEFGRKHCLCRSDVYSFRKMALEEFVDILTDKYDL